MDKKMYSYSFIIPCFNEEKDINNTLEACLAQDYKGEFDIICVDDGSKDKTVEIILDFAKENPSIKLIQLNSNRGVSYARNVGCDNSKNDVVIFLNADELPQKNFLDSINKKYARGADYFFPQTTVKNTDTLYGKYREAYRRSKYSKQNTLLWSQGFSCKREVFKIIHGFNEIYPGCGGEDWDLVLRIEKLGLNRCVDFNVVVYHTVPCGIKNIIWHMFNRGRGTANCELFYEGMSKVNMLAKKLIPIVFVFVLFCICSSFAIGVVFSWLAYNQNKVSRIWKASNGMNYLMVLMFHYIESCMRFLGYVITVIKYNKRRNKLC